MCVFYSSSFTGNFIIIILVEEFILSSVVDVLEYFQNPFGKIFLKKYKKKKIIINNKR